MTRPAQKANDGGILALSALIIPGFLLLTALVLDVGDVVHPQALAPESRGRGCPSRRESSTSPSSRTAPRTHRSRCHDDQRQGEALRGGRGRRLQRDRQRAAQRDGEDQRGEPHGPTTRRRQHVPGPPRNGTSGPDQPERRDLDGRDRAREQHRHGRRRLRHEYAQHHGEGACRARARSRASREGCRSSTRRETRSSASGRSSSAPVTAPQRGSPSRRRTRSSSPTFFTWTANITNLQFTNAQDDVAIQYYAGSKNGNQPCNFATANKSGAAPTTGLAAPVAVDWINVYSTGPSPGADQRPCSGGSP